MMEINVNYYQMLLTRAKDKDAAIEAMRLKCEAIARRIHAEVLAADINDCEVGKDIANAIAALKDAKP